MKDAVVADRGLQSANARRANRPDLGAFLSRLVQDLGRPRGKLDLLKKDFDAWEKTTVEADFPE